MQKKYKFLWPLLIPLTFAIIAIPFFYNGQKKHNAMVADYTKRPINGKVVSLRDAQRGSWFIDIDDNISKTKLSYVMQIAWYIREYNIQPGDSVCKTADNNIILFYKLHNRKYTKSCEYIFE